MAILEGPSHIAESTAQNVLVELERHNAGQWLRSDYQIHDHGDHGEELVVSVFIPDEQAYNADLINKILDIFDNLIVQYVPAEIPIRDDGYSWSALIVAGHDVHRALMAGTTGGRDRAGPNYRN